MQNPVTLSKIASISYVYFTMIRETLNGVVIWLSVAIMWHRYNAIHETHVDRARCLMISRIQAVVILVASLLYNLPFAFENSIVHYPGSRIVGFTTTAFGKSKAFELYYCSVAFYAFNYIIPMAALIFFTHRSKKLLHEKLLACRNVQTQSEITENEVARSLISIVCMFAVCHLLLPR
jgi:hypothetical protein